MSLQYIDIYAVDSKGRQVPTFNEPLTIELEGAATLQAMDNGDHFTNLLFNNITTKPMQQGYMQVILRSKHESGQVRLNVSTPSLKKSHKLTCSPVTR